MSLRVHKAGDNDHFSDVEESEETVPRIPINAFPPLLPRSPGYWAEPWMGICVVGVMSLLLVGVTNACAEGSGLPRDIGRLMRIVIWSEAAVAVSCCAYILFGEAGEIRRSPATCYPMPVEVEEKLLASEATDGLANIEGPPGSETLGSYCVRCLVWRPRKGRGMKSKSHHCHVCQRCYVGFDHHCGVFGRCIVAGNMPCFVALIAMLLCGMLTAMIALSLTPPPETAGDPPPIT
eukprot:TRINITY_DN12339_c0_g1_i3.p1 TRINITY_DN12339_c0_g1~~TRINITY_DN12339_c0_g1_i3.p1  ORF type:complete len:235 (-),score=30.10 TRINITY_DN12339_c0_g1_i3:117-821(-)